MKGRLFVISGPSGVGKNTILNQIIMRCENVRYSISATSRAMRPGEINGESYYFVSREKFEQMIAQGELLEYAEYVGNYYGTPLKPIQDATNQGVDIVMDVEVIGALKIKEKMPDAVLVFVTAPSFEEIERRLLNRGDVAKDVMQDRLERARWESEQSSKYDYIVLNDTVENAIDKLIAIMKAEKCRTTACAVCK